MAHGDGASKEIRSCNRSASDEGKRGDIVWRRVLKGSAGQ